MSRLRVFLRVPIRVFLSERVKELTQGRQTPTTKPNTVSDFPLAVRQ